MLDRKHIQSLDSQNMLSSIEVLHKQVAEAWNATSTTVYPEQYKQAKRIVWFGMGGSQLGIDLVKNLAIDTLTVPIEIVNDYTIPAIVDKDTLVVLSSYSGTTEEVTTVARGILTKTQMVVVTSTGGDLEAFATEHQLPAYIFNPVHNPSNQPRMAVGYSVAGTLGMFSALGFVEVTQSDIDATVEHIQSLHAQFGPDNSENNTAKQLAEQMADTIPMIISSEFLQGSAHVMTNQMNENSKQFAARFPIPEMNHHLIEGFIFPKENKPLMVFITSNLYHPRNQKRHEVTMQLARDNGLPAARVGMQGKTKLNQAMELLVFGSYVSLYRAVLNGVDPAPIPNVDYLKNALKQG